MGRAREGGGGGGRSPVGHDAMSANLSSKIGVSISVVRSRTTPSLLANKNFSCIDLVITGGTPIDAKS